MTHIARYSGYTSRGRPIVVGKTKRAELVVPSDIEILSGSGSVFGRLKRPGVENFRVKAAEGLIAEINKLEKRANTDFH